MYCKNCGFEFPADEYKFCPNCGQSQELTLSNEKLIDIKIDIAKKNIRTLRIAGFLSTMMGIIPIASRFWNYYYSSKFGPRDIQTIISQAIEKGDYLKFIILSSGYDDIYLVLGIFLLLLGIFCSYLSEKYKKMLAKGDLSFIK